MLNILLDNFPYSFNPLAVLDIDMFVMTEEKLQDSLTKTMSVAFEVTLLCYVYLWTHPIGTFSLLTLLPYNPFVSTY